MLNASFNYSKSLSNDDQLGYYNREGKARTSYDQENSFGAYVIYELPVGKGQKWLNRGGVLNAVLGGWKVDVSENILSGIPLSVSSQRQPQPVPDRLAASTPWCPSNRPRSTIGPWATASRPRRRTPTST